MKKRILGVAMALALLLTGCSDDGGKDESSGPSSGTTPSSTATIDPGPSIGAQLKALEKDAVAIDARAEVLVPSSATPELMELTMYRADSYNAGRGVMYMQAALTVRYPGLDGLRNARDFLRVLKRNGFGTSVGYHVDDIVHGTVQRATDLQCRAFLSHDNALLSCIPNDFFDLVEYDVADPVTTLFAAETHSVDIGGWEVFYPQPYDAKPPVGVLLRTGIHGGREEFRAYLYQSERWELVGRATSFAGIGRVVARRFCLTGKRAAFSMLCPGASA